MSALSATDPGRLSSVQEELLDHYRDHWQQVRNSTAPADRAEAEYGVALAYAAVGLDPPARTVWCSSPVAIELSRKATWHEFDPGPLVKPLIVDNLIRRVATTIDNSAPVRIRSAAATALEVEWKFLSASATLSNELQDSASRTRWSMGARKRAFIGRLARRQYTQHLPFNVSRWLQHEHVGFLAKCAFLHNACGMVKATDVLQGLWRIATNVGAMLPHKRVCWLSERHDILKLDINGRLHSREGPAVRYPDGWCRYAWKGAIVPGWIIDQTDQINARAIERERDPIVRHSMIDIITPQKYIATGAAMVVARDNTGTLWRKPWTDWGTAWAAVEVVNGTPELDGSRRHYFLQVPADVHTPIEAVAWTYGMSAERYAKLLRRT